MADPLPEPPRAGSLRTRLVLGLIVLAGSWGAAWFLRRRRIRTVDLTAPDAFGAAVVRE